MIVYIIYVIKRIYRTPFPYTAAILITFAFSALLGSLRNTLDVQNKQLAVLYDNMKINCVFADPSGKTDNILITNTLIDVCVSGNYKLSQYIENPLFKRSLNYNTMDGEALLVGVNSNRFYENLRDLPDNVFQGNENVLFVNEHSSYKVGDVVKLNVRLGSAYEDVKFFVMGVYPGEKDDTIYCPWNVICELALDLGGQISAESGSFTLADNRELNEFKVVAKEYFDTVDVSGNGMTTKSSGIAMIINDNEFRIATTAVTRNVNMLETLVPIFYVLTIVIGFFISFLLIRNRYLEFDLMRRIGMKPCLITAMILFEQSLLALIGVSCGINLVREPIGIMFFILYIFGAFASSLLIYKKSIMRTRSE